jgi:protein-L-isoaspartate(D-aspartate) O-methyltransferase
LANYFKKDMIETMSLLDILVRDKWLKTPAIIKAFKVVKRSDFLPENLKDLAEINEALPIGFGQTISQPLVVAFMLELLKPKVGNKVLDIGSGSGWTSALLGYLVSGNFLEGNKKNLKGKVIGLEIIPELAEFGRKNVAKYNFIEKGIVEIVCADGSQGYPPAAPFDRILVSAAAKDLPQHLKDQLKIGGRLVIPIQESIWLFEKKSTSHFESQEFPGFVFVPLIS